MRLTSPPASTSGRTSASRSTSAMRSAGAGFSLEAPEGVRFLIRSELCAVDDVAARR